MGSKGLKEGDIGSWQGICSQSYTLFFPHPGQYCCRALKGQRAFVTLPNIPKIPWAEDGLSRPYQQQQVLLVCFLLKTLQGPEQSLSIQKASHDTIAGSELCSGQPMLPALSERPFEPTEGCEQVGRGSDFWQFPPSVCLGDTLTLWESSHQPRYLSDAGDGHPGGSR